MSSKESESLDYEFDKSCFLCFRLFSFVSRFLLLDFLYLPSFDKSDVFLLLDLLHFLSSDESDSLDDESDDDGSESGSASMCTFHFFYEDSVGRVRGVGFGVFFNRYKSNCDVIPLVVFIPR